MNRYTNIFCLLLALAPALGISVFAENKSTDLVDYFTDNGFGSAFRQSGVHHQGTTYVAYQGPLEDAHVAAYNHETGEWLGPFMAGESALGKDPNAEKIDNHGQPAMVIDAEGYIHIAYGGHGGKPANGENPLGDTHGGEMRHVVTKKPLDISSWERLDNIPPFGTYNDFIKMDNDDIYLFYRHGAHRSNWVYQKSSDNGRTFESPVSILKTQRRTDMAAEDAWYATFLKVPGDKIVARVYYHICKDVPNHDGERQNGYYIEMSTKDHIWRNIHGEALDTPLTKQYADENALVVNTGDKWVHGGPIAWDTAGRPHFLLYLGDDTGHVHGGPKVVHHYRWTGEAWTASENPQMPRVKGNLQVSSPENVDILLAGRNDEGTGEVVWWNSTDGGATFKRGNTYFSLRKSGVMISDFIQNAHPDARILVAGTKSGTDFSKLYLVGDNGPIQRKGTEASQLSEEQKTMPRVVQ